MNTASIVIMLQSSVHRCRRYEKGGRGTAAALQDDPIVRARLAVPRPPLRLIAAPIQQDCDPSPWLPVSYEPVLQLTIPPRTALCSRPARKTGEIVELLPQ